LELVDVVVKKEKKKNRKTEKQTLMFAVFGSALSRRFPPSFGTSWLGRRIRSLGLWSLMRSDANHYCYSS
jgi:hypothetical protein